MVEYYGADTPLKSLATISAPDSQTIQIQPFDYGFDRVDREGHWDQ